MINYLQLGRNLRRFAQRAEAKSVTYIYNAKGIYDFKQMNPKINEELTNSFRGVEQPVLEVSVKKAKHPAGVLTIKDGKNELSTNTFILDEGERVEDYLPETDGCIKKFIYDKDGINQIGEQYDLLKKILQKMTAGLKKPSLEFWMKHKTRYSIGNMILKDGEREVTRGYFSKTYDTPKPVEKFHFITDNQLISGYGIHKDMISKIFARLPEKLRKRLWLLDERTKSIVKTRYGVGCSPKTSEEIAKHWKLSGARIREIVKIGKTQMEEANTYNKDLGADLDNMGHILSDGERYKIYKEGRSIDVNAAEYKIKQRNIALQKFIRKN